MSSPTDPVQSSMSLVDQLSGWSNLATVLVAFVSLIISVLAFLRSGPKIRVSLTTARNLDNGRYATFVRVTNNGRVAVHIQTVRLISRLGTATPVSIHGAPKLPCELPAYGGSEQWGFDRQELRAIAASHAIAQQTEFCAVVTSGRRRYRSKNAELVHGGEPTQTPIRTPPLCKRISLWFRRLIVPRLQIVNGYPIDSIDLNDKTYVLYVRNFGGGLGCGTSLELIKWSKEQSVRERIDLPGIHRHQTHSVTVPLQADTGLNWALRLPDGRLSGVSIEALTLGKAREILSEADGLSS